jgi:hypothetical protein
MRGTVAKRIRKLVQRDFIGQPERSYVEIQHKGYLVPTAALGQDGKQIMQTITPIQVKLSEGCQRNISQYVKRHYAGQSFTQL